MDRETVIESGISRVPAKFYNRPNLLVANTNSTRVVYWLDKKDNRGYDISSLLLELL